MVTNSENRSITLWTCRCKRRFRAVCHISRSTAELRTNFPCDYCGAAVELDGALIRICCEVGGAWIDLPVARTSAPGAPRAEAARVLTGRSGLDKA